MKSSASIWACRNIDRNVPVFTSEWVGTMHTIEPLRRTAWLPRWRTNSNPKPCRIFMISCPESKGNLGTSGNLESCNKGV